jgi:hypothetical protein
LRSRHGNVTKPSSTFFQLAEPLSAACSSTKSASRQFITMTVTPPGVFWLGLGLIGAAAASAVVCASAGTAFK